MGLEERGTPVPSGELPEGVSPAPVDPAPAEPVAGQVISFSFGVALDVLKSGRRVTRLGWSSGAFIAYQPGYPDGIPINANTAKATGKSEGTVLKFQPYLMAYDDRTESCVPWQPMQRDLLATDWTEAA